MPILNLKSNIFLIGLIALAICNDVSSSGTEHQVQQLEEQYIPVDIYDAIEQLKIIVDSYEQKILENCLSKNYLNYI